MKRAALIIGASLAVAGPLALALSAQDQTGEITTGYSEEEAPFPWPDFLEVDPLPGEYRVSITMLDFNFSGLEGGKDDTSLIGEEGGTEVEYFCLAGEPNRENWFDELGGESCTQRQFDVDGSAFTMSMQCPDNFGGGPMTMRVAGEATEQGLDIRMHMRAYEGDLGKMTMDMRVAMERMGECEGVRTEAK